MLLWVGCCIGACTLAAYGTCVSLSLFLPALLLGARLGRIPETVWPGNLPRLLLQGPRQQLAVGQTAFAESGAYTPYNVTEEERAHYYTEGWLHLRGALPPRLVSELRQHLLRRSGAALWPWSINGQYSDSELLDFYLFSPLGSIASQLFRGEPALLWSDFRYFRAAGQRITMWHTDTGECENEFLPANFTAESRLRFWISLDDDVRSPVLMPQTAWRDLVSRRDYELYMAGRLERPPRSIEDVIRMLDRNSAARRRLKGVAVRLGDVLIHSPCLIHASPTVRDTSRKLTAFLCPTYQPASSRFYLPKASPEHARRNCRNRLRVGDSMVDEPCFPQAYPAPDHLRGKDLSFTYGTQDREGDLLHWFSGFIGRRYMDLQYWDPEDIKQSAGGVFSEGQFYQTKELLEAFFEKLLPRFMPSMHRQ